MVAIIDYDAGNLKNVMRALGSLGAESMITDDKEKLFSASHVILPGVGSFGDAMGKLSQRGLCEVIREIALSGKPFLGVCLGLQLLFTDSEESPGVKGLDILKGHILRFPSNICAQSGLKVPHMGWNSVAHRPDSRLFNGVKDEEYFYFVHSYYLDAEDKNAVAGTCDYGVTFDAAVESGNIFATQFHPEKSSGAGLNLLKNFLTF